MNKHSFSLDGTCNNVRRSFLLKILSWRHFFCAVEQTDHLESINLLTCCSILQNDVSRNTNENIWDDKTQITVNANGTGNRKTKLPCRSFFAHYRLPFHYSVYVISKFLVFIPTNSTQQDWLTLDYSLKMTPHEHLSWVIENSTITLPKLEQMLFRATYCRDSFQSFAVN